MLQQVFAPGAGLLPDTASAAIAGLIEQVRPAVVQVSSRGRGNGAGVIWHAAGMIMTNHHVIAHAGPGLFVRLSDGRTLEAQVIASNPTLDLALLEVAAQGLPAAPIGESRHLRVGELVFAIGHPWGQRDVVTAGIVSGLGTVTSPRGDWEAQYLRSDVRLAPGNSGGPLLSAAGQVVGINAMIFGGDLAVSIPSHVASAWAGGVPGQRAFLGVGAQPAELPAAARQGNWAGQERGLLLVQVQPGSPAERSGLMVGDLLLDLGGTALSNSEALIMALGRYTAGEAAHVNLLRAGTILGLEVVLAARERQ